MIKSSLKCTCFSISTEESIQDVRTAGVLLIVGMHVYRKEYFTYYAKSFIKMHP